MFKRCAYTILISFLFLFSCRSDGGREKRIVILIGDGMGFEQIRAAEYFNGKTFSLKDRAIYSGSITTANYDGDVTDSAAGATAIATGQKVSNGVLSRRIPGDSSDLETLFEYAKNRGYDTGLVTTSTIIDATPAAFVSHSSSRSDFAQVSAGFIFFKPGLVIGGLTYLTQSDFEYAGYTVFSSPDFYYSSWLHAYIFVRLSDGPVPYEYETLIASGVLPRYLSRSTNFARDYFHNSARFILMIEGGRIDHAGHAGSIENNVYETNEFFAAASEIYNMLEARGNYLMIIAADHETGGLNVLNDNGAGNFPDVEWTSALAEGKYSHTSRAVPALVFSDLLSPEDMDSISDNTDLHKVVTDFINYQ